MCANMKAKRVNIQKSHVFADLMYIFSENGSTIIFGSYGVNCRCTILFGVIKFTAIGLYQIVLLGQEIVPNKYRNFSVVLVELLDSLYLHLYYFLAETYF